MSQGNQNNQNNQAQLKLPKIKQIVNTHIEESNNVPHFPLIFKSPHAQHKRQDSNLFMNEQSNRRLGTRGVGNRV